MRKSKFFPPECFDRHIRSNEVREGNRMLLPGTLNGIDGQNTLLKLIVRQAPYAIMACDIRQKITLANAAARRLATIEPEGRSLDSVAEIWGEMVDGKGIPVPAHRWPCRQALHGKSTAGKQCRLVRSGRARDFLFSAVPLRNRSGHIVGAVAAFSDVTDCNHEWLQRCQEAVRRERDRMASDLHDTLAQGLNAVVLQLQVAEDDLSGNNNDEALRHLRRARDVAHETLAFARSSMWTLSDEPHASQFDDDRTGDLAAALSFLARQLFAATPIKLTFSLEQQACALAPNLKVDLLRIGREALANVLKHARATAVSVRLLYKRGQVELSVDDNGRGFVGAPSSQFPRTFGLSGMRQRARRMGGTVTVKSRPGRGTRVTALVPFIPADQQKAVA